ncbi:16986_t:CDS:2, partial [Gigaspora rosea]
AKKVWIPRIAKKSITEYEEKDLQDGDNLWSTVCGQRLVGNDLWATTCGQRLMQLVGDNLLGNNLWLMIAGRQRLM